jgi:hypothetical protein
MFALADEIGTGAAYLAPSMILNLVTLHAPSGI